MQVWQAESFAGEWHSIIEWRKEEGGAGYVNTPAALTYYAKWCAAKTGAPPRKTTAAAAKTKAPTACKRKASATISTTTASANRRSNKRSATVKRSRTTATQKQHKLTLTSTRVILGAQLSPRFAATAPSSPCI